MRPQTPLMPARLFPDPPSCTHPRCPAGTRKNLCHHDAQIAHGLVDALTARPKGCINTAQNRDDIPY